LSAVRARILVVDDDKAVRAALQVNLSKAGHNLTVVESADAALRALQDRAYDLILTDVMMPGTGGLALLAQVKATWPDTQVVVMTGHGSVADAVQAMKDGAADYIIKPVSKDELLVILERALREKALLAEVLQLRAELRSRYGFENLVGTTPIMQEVYEQVAAVADSSALVLLTGPTGTGKEVLAHALHYRSPRRERPFVGVNCGALPEGLLESELFGHEKGAFTGAVRQHRGRFEQADGGSLLLDEIGEIPPATQVKLLRVLENGTFQRVGGSDTVRVDVRVIAATNRDLRREVKEGRFRQDLYYRLNVFHIEVPALRQRRDDIPLLVDHFIRKFAERYDRRARRVTADTMDKLMRHSWPGNVRELEHVIERAIILTSGDEITSVRLPEVDPDDVVADDVVPSGTNLAEHLKDVERKLIVEALRREMGVQARAARLLGISRSNLNYRIQRLNIELTDVSYD
jgi:DNA-binding NtrC family response regulator